MFVLSHEAAMLWALTFVSVANNRDILFVSSIESRLDHAYEYFRKCIEDIDVTLHSWVYGGRIYIYARKAYV